MGRLLSLHFSVPPDAGGLEIATWELAWAANQTPDWEGIVISGTHPAWGLANTDSPACIFIPEIGPINPERDEIFDAFRCGAVHRSVFGLSARIESRLDEIIRPGDLLVSFNSFAQPFCVPLTLALRNISVRRADFTHVTWSSDLAIRDPQYDWTAAGSEPWSLFWKAWEPIRYIVSSEPVRATQAEAFKVDREMIGVVPMGVNPANCLRLPQVVSELCVSRDLYAAFPLLLMPVRMSQRKNIAKAIEAIHALKIEFPAAHLIITGSISPHDRGSRKRLDDLVTAVQNRGLHNRVTILSEAPTFGTPITHDVCMSFLAICDGLVFTSDYEGFLIPILEAGLYKIPVIAPPLAEIRSWASGFVHFYPENATAEDIALFIGELFRGPEYKIKFKFRSEFSWATIFKKYFAGVYG